MSGRSARRSDESDHLRQGTPRALQQRVTDAALEGVVRDTCEGVALALGDAPTFNMAVSAARILEEEADAWRSFAGRLLGHFLLDRLRRFQRLAPRTAPLMALAAVLDAVRDGKLPKGLEVIPKDRGPLH